MTICESMNRKGTDEPSSVGRTDTDREHKHMITKGNEMWSDMGDWDSCNVSRC